MVAHFDYFINKGDPQHASTWGVVITPKEFCGSSQMYDTNSTAGGYANSIVHTTTCPAIATALQTVFGSYLLNMRVAITTTVDNNIPSMCGGNRTGASSAYIWDDALCVCPTESQVYGFPVTSSSMYDTGEGTQKLALFNFLSIYRYRRGWAWLRDVADHENFSMIDYYGRAEISLPTYSRPLRPLVYIG